MARGDRAGLPAFGWDYDVVRWTTGGRDSEGHIVWHDTLPSNRQMQHVKMFTAELPDGSMRNVRVPADRRMDVYDPESDDPDHYDFDDAMAQIFIAYGYEV